MSKPQPIQISIPQPCHEDWNKMTPTEQGRYCSSCQKCVVDFTRFTDRQLYEFFSKHQGQKICGQVNNSQLNRLILPPQQRTLIFKKYYAFIGLTIALLEYPVKDLFAKAHSYNHITTHSTYAESDEKTILSIAVLDNDKNPIQDAIINIQTIDSSIVEYFTDFEGRCKIELAQGTYNISISNTSYESYKKQITINKGVNSLSVTLNKHANTDSVVYNNSYRTGGLIDPSTDNRVLTNEDIEKMPTRSTQTSHYKIKKGVWQKIKSWFN